MQTVTVDVINDKAMRLLQDLETLDLIKLRGVAEDDVAARLDKIRKLKGSLAKQPVEEIERQLKELRDAWE